MDVSSEGEAITDESSGMSPVVLSILVIIPLVIIVGLVIFLRNKNEKSIQFLLLHMDRLLLQHLKQTQLLVLLVGNRFYQ